MYILNSLDSQATYAYDLFSLQYEHCKTSRNFIRQFECMLLKDFVLTITIETILLIRSMSKKYTLLGSGNHTTIVNI